MSDEIRRLEVCFRRSLELHAMSLRMEKEFGVSLVQWSVLRHLRDLPGTPAALLARAVGVQASSLTPTLRRLATKQCLFIEVDTQDARRKLVSLTRTGMLALERVEKGVSQWSTQDFAPAEN